MLYLCASKISKNTGYLYRIIAVLNGALFYCNICVSDISKYTQDIRIVRDGRVAGRTHYNGNSCKFKQAGSLSIINTVSTLIITRCFSRNFILTTKVFLSKILSTDKLYV